MALYINHAIHHGNILILLHLEESPELIELYKFQSLGNVKSNIFSSYDLSLNKKYKVKVFQNTLERIKNNFN